MAGGRRAASMPAMTTNLRSIALGAVVSGAAFAVCGAINATQDFGGTHNPIDSTGEYLVTGALALALFLIAPLYRLLGQLADRPKAGLAAAGAQIVLGLLSATSVLNGEDLAVFNVLAPICLLTWLVASIVLTVGLRRTNAVPKAVAYALPAVLFVTFPLSPLGGPLLTGAFFLAIGTQLGRQGGLRTVTA